MLSTGLICYRFEDKDAMAIYESLKMARNPEDIILRKKPQTHSLDDEAMRIYEQLQVIKDDRMSYADEQRRLNDWRRCLVNFTSKLSQTLNRYRQGRATVNIHEDIRPLMDRLNVLAQIPSEEKEKRLIIRHRGVQLSVEESEDIDEFNSETDYVISVGNCVIDMPFLTYLVHTKILNDPALIDNMNKAFKFLSLARIFIIEIKLNDWNLEDKQHAEISLMHLAQFFERVVKKDSNIIYNEAKLPDPNLTMVCGLSKLPPKNFQGLVHNITIKMSDSESKKKLSSAKSVYDALFLINNIKSKMVRPAVEVNNNTCIQMWRHCFDDTGRFNRSQFHRFQPEFKKWEQAFYFFWNDLKAVTNEKDRTTILNCLLKFMKDSNRIIRYIEHILKDFFYYPLHLQVSDLNSLIFTNMLLFKNFVNQSYDFGRTPEEVLLSSEEKNSELIEKLNQKINTEWSDRFHAKIKTIQKNLEKALESRGNESSTLPSKFLISLNRELFIFLSLTESLMINRLLAIALEEYGDPQSSFYHARNSSENMKDLLQFLKVVIRCQVMLGNKKNIELLSEIKERENQFISLKTGLLEDTSFHKKVVANIMSILNEGIGRLTEASISLSHAPAQSMA